MRNVLVVWCTKLCSMRGGSCTDIYTTGVSIMIDSLLLIETTHTHIRALVGEESWEVAIPLTTKVNSYSDILKIANKANVFVSQRPAVVVHRRRNCTVFSMFLRDVIISVHLREKRDFPLVVTVRLSTAVNISCVTVWYMDEGFDGYHSNIISLLNAYVAVRVFGGAAWVILLAKVSSIRYGFYGYSTDFITIPCTRYCYVSNVIMRLKPKLPDAWSENL